nr:unnamed protein product [Callosobruchus chinensis]
MQSREGQFDSSVIRN